MSPYGNTSCTDEEHQAYRQLAAYTAEKCARVIAKGTMRLGVAHRYLLLAHLDALCEGAGNDAAEVFLEELLAAVRKG